MKQHKTIWCLVLLSCLCVSALADEKDINHPDRRHLYLSDTRTYKKAKKKKVKAITKALPAATQDLDVKAPKVEFKKDNKTVHATGGVRLSISGTRVESDTAEVNTDTKDANLNGKVVVTTPDGAIAAETGAFNMNSEQGKFKCGDVAMEGSIFTLDAQSVEKVGDESFSLSKAQVSACQIDNPDRGTCAGVNKARPWTIHADTVHITRNGYAHAYNSWMDFYGVPVFYSPYLGFPVKDQRQSGLLYPSFGYDNQDGFQASIPLFVTLGESADIRIDPFTETRTRTGLGFDYRQAFSRYNQLTSRIIYSNESARGDSLRGTDITGLSDPTFDENRFGGFYKHSWRSSPNAEIPLSYVADVHLVSDDLFLREIEDEKIGDIRDPQLVSTAALRSTLGEYGTAELIGEYVQAVDGENDRFLFQRLPELQVNLSHSYHPFGYNEYGFKAVPKLQYLGDEFARTEGYDGFRSHIVPALSLPFHFKNYTQASLNFVYQHTDYLLNDKSTPGDDSVFDSSYDRNVPGVGFVMQTGVERVYNVDSNGWFARAVSLGAGNQDASLARIKHTFEPVVKFTYIPDVDQDQNPFFDGLDRIRQKKLMAYGFNSSLYGRFVPPHSSNEKITEVIPDVSDLPTIQGDATPLSDVGAASDLSRVGGGLGVKNGEIRELVRLSVLQAYDYIEDHNNLNQNRNAFSDIDSQIQLTPNDSFGLQFDSSYSMEEGIFDYWRVANHLYDDRGDALRAIWTYNRDVSTNRGLLSQVELNGELKLHEQLKLGAYSRFDELRGRNIENRFGFRYFNNCKCWYIDFGVGEKRNPDKQYVLFSFTFNGLGAISSSARYGDEASNN